jgi:hypothetical protein
VGQPGRPQTLSRGCYRKRRALDDKAPDFDRNEEESDN